MTSPMHSPLQSPLQPVMRSPLDFRRRGGGSFDIASTNPSAYYDRTNLATLFQDSLGTTPVTAGSQPIGLGLDQSQGLALGTEVIPAEADRDFTSDTGYWLTEGTSTIGGGQVVFSVGPSQAPIYKFNTLPQGYFEATLTCTISSGSIFIRLGNANTNFMTSSGTYTGKAYNTLLATLAVVSDSAGCVGTLDHFSVRYVQGNHASQPTAGKRPLTAGSPIYADFDAVDDDIVTTFPTSLGAGCTVCRSLPGTGASITTGVTLTATYTDNVDAHALLIYTAAQWAALDAGQIANITTWLNGRAGL